MLKPSTYAFKVGQKEALWGVWASAFFGLCCSMFLGYVVITDNQGSGLDWFGASHTTNVRNLIYATFVPPTVTLPRSLAASLARSLAPSLPPSLPLT